MSYSKCTWNTQSINSESRGALVKPYFPSAEPDIEQHFLLRSSLLQTSQQHMDRAFIGIQEWDHEQQECGVLQQRVKQQNSHLQARTYCCCATKSPYRYLQDLFGLGSSASYPLKSTQLRRLYKPGSSEKVTTSLNCSQGKGDLFL